MKSFFKLSSFVVVLIVMLMTIQLWLPVIVFSVVITAILASIFVAIIRIIDGPLPSPEEIQ